MTKKVRILIVDDESAIRDTLYYNLCDYGYEVFTADGGDAALKKIKDIKFDVIISDIFMLNGTGITLLKELRKKSNDIPVILFTGCSTKETARAAVKLCAYDYLHKPVPIKLLISVLSKAVSQ